MDDQQEQEEIAEASPEEIETLRDGQAEIVGLRADIELLTLKWSDEVEHVTQLKADLIESERARVESGVREEDRFSRLFAALYGEDPTKEDFDRMTWRAMFVEIRNRGNLDARTRQRLADAQRELAGVQSTAPHGPTTAEQRREATLTNEVAMPAVPGLTGTDIVPTDDPSRIIVDLEPGVDRFTPVELGGTFRAEDPESLVIDPMTGAVPGSLTPDMIRKGVLDARPDIRSGKTVIAQPKNHHLDVGQQKPEETERLRSDWREDYQASRAALSNPSVQENLGPEGAEFGTIRETIRRGVEEVEGRERG